MADAAETIVRHFRQILIWPLQLMPLAQPVGSGAVMGRHWELMNQLLDEDSPWQMRPSVFDMDPQAFQERHYREFVTFLPYVQRFLYGEGAAEAGSTASYGGSPLHVFRRHDICTVRMHYKDGTRQDFKVAHIDLYFFYDIDIVILAFEILADNVPLSRVQDTLFRFGRAFPAQWDEDKTAASCLQQVKWLDVKGGVIAASDYNDKSKFLSHVGEFRAAPMAQHWDALLRPLVLHHSNEIGELRYRQIEYHRMPLMAYLAFDDPFDLSDEDFYRLGMVTRPSQGGDLPYTAKVFQDFEANCCYDRFWVPERRHDSSSTRMMCDGHAFVLVGKHTHGFFSDPFTGALGQFRHQYFLLMMIAHFHKAALLMFSDRLAVALSRLQVGDAGSARRFKRDIHILQEVFLRFTQRYWFSEISNQVVADQMFHIARRHLGTEALFTEVRESIHSMSQYLENDDLHRQADTVVRLTVVTILGLVGTTVTGFLGMNLFDLAAEPSWRRIGYFFVTFIPIAVLTFYSLMKSRMLSEFLDFMSDDRMRFPDKIKIIHGQWCKKRQARNNL
ncbi:hypothetical protein [Janthinobacterium sp. B9-8]|uniref:hypothetical protein n=1 Tax=Janthinobacterium sp. B9-8 TaxID=1236179 RepID=UPI00061D3AA4|nr:hypothetical protein [Janthinobacterium sp. B9-8]AMC34405.1 hypothetical protein VN23_07215 [Janthinobacterium sp. B9-8]